MPKGKVKFEREEADLKLIYLAYFAASLLCSALASLERMSIGEMNRYDVASGILDALMKRYPVTLTEEQTRYIAKQADKLYGSVMSNEFVVDWQL